MTRSEKLLHRLEEECRKVPGISLRDLAKRLNLAEKAALLLLEDSQARKVRSDLEDKLLSEIQAWGMGFIQIQNDWAGATVGCDLKGLSVKDGLLSVKTESTSLRIDYARVDSIYFVEFGGRTSVQFFNKKGRLIFEVLPPADPGFVERFRRARESLCTALVGAKT